MLDCDCPRCGSRNTKAFPVLYENGTWNSAHRKHGLFYYRRSLGLHASTTSGQRQTVAARHAAPPASLRFSSGGVAIVLFVAIAIAGEAGFWVALSLLIALAIGCGIGGGPSHSAAVREWSATFRCGRCGTIFAVIEEASSG